MLKEKNDRCNKDIEFIVSTCNHQLQEIFIEHFPDA